MKKYTSESKLDFWIIITNKEMTNTLFIQPLKLFKKEDSVISQ